MNTLPISVLVTARKNSKYLAKFLSNLVSHTSSLNNIGLSVVLNKNDTWNLDVIDAFRRLPWLQFIYQVEDNGLGRGGLHFYFTGLHAMRTYEADWIVYFCDDHSIIAKDWDLKVLEFAKKNNLDPSKPYAIIPKFDNVGTMNHILSRGMVEALEGIIGRHGWIDSYLNYVLDHVRPKDRIAKMDEEIFHDFTHDTPNPMSDEHCKTELSEAGKSLPPFQSEEVMRLVDADAARINKAIENE